MARPDRPAETNQTYAVGLSRAFGGAVLFATPLIMTMEMWSLGFVLSRPRLLLFIAVNFGVLVGLSYFAGFEKTFRWRDDVLDALAAFGVGVITSAAMLLIFAVLSAEMTWGEIFGKVALQSVPASIGAMLGTKQLGGEQDTQAEEERKREAGYPGELFLMLAGALFLAFNIAPTDEVQLIAFQMTPWHGLALVLTSLGLLHLFVYAVGFAGQESMPEGARAPVTFLTYTVVGYAIALAMSAYVLWTFGRTDEVGLSEVVMMTAVLGFPAVLGAATARLIV